MQTTEVYSPMWKLRTTYLRVKSGSERNSRLPLSRYSIAQKVGRPAGRTCRPQNGCCPEAAMPPPPAAVDGAADAAAPAEPENMSAVAAESP